MIEGAAARDGELFLYALLTVMSRMTAPWQLIRLGVKVAGSDTAARVAKTNYGVAVSIVLAELERMVDELREDLRTGQGNAVGSLLKTIHDSARGLRTELALPVDSTWGRALAAQRTQISDLLRAEIESMPAVYSACCGREHREKYARIRFWIQMKSLKSRRWSNLSACADILLASSPLMK